MTPTHATQERTNRDHAASALLGIAAVLLMGGAAALAATEAGPRLAAQAGRGIMLRQAGLLCLAHEGGDGGDAAGGMPCFTLAEAAPDAWFGQPGRN